MPSLKHIVLFFLGALLLTSWHSDSGLNDNSTSRAAMVAALVKHGTLRIDAHHWSTGDKALIDGHYYSDKAPLPALLVTPIWWIADRSGMVRTRSQCMPHALLQVGGFLCGSVPLAIIITLLWLRLRRSGVRAPAVLAVLALVGSFLFVYSSSFYGHLPGALFLLLALIAAEKEGWLIAGAWAGAAMSCEYTLALFVPFLVLATRIPAPAAVLTRGLRMFAGAAPFLVLLMLYNWRLSGDPFSPAYQHEANYTFMSESMGFGGPSLGALWGLTFSPYRGLFFYMPVLIAGVAAWLIARGTNVKRLFSGPVAWGVLLSVLAVSSYKMWWGGWAYGPRHLTAAAVLLAWRLLPAIGRTRWAWWPAGVLGVAGFVFAFMAKSTVWYSLPTEVRDPLAEEILPHFLHGDFTTMQWPVELGLPPAMATLLFPVVAAGVIFALDRLDRSIA